MPILKDCAIFHTRLDPKRPNAKYNTKNPTWELQIRTDDPEQKKNWEANNLRPKLMVHKEGTPNEGEPILNEAGRKQWRVKLKKNSLDKHGEPAKPVDLVNGSLTPIDPNSIGNGSIAHLRIYQYTYEKKDNGGKGVASILMGVQLKRHIVYEGSREEFDMEDTETIMPESDDAPEQQTAAPSLTPSAPKTPTPMPVDQRPETAF